jgi:hypothetical protein
MSDLIVGSRVFHPRFCLGWVDKVWPSGNAHVKFDDEWQLVYLATSSLKVVVSEKTYARPATPKKGNAGE